MAFSVWLLSLSIMFLHISELQFLLISRYFTYFKVCNSVVLSIFTKFLCKHMVSMLLGYMPRHWIAGSYANSMFNCLSYWKSGFQNICPTLRSQPRSVYSRKNSWMSTRTADFMVCSITLVPSTTAQLWGSLEKQQPKFVVQEGAEWSSLKASSSPNINYLTSRITWRPSSKDSSLFELRAHLVLSSWRHWPKTFIGKWGFCVCVCGECLRH